MLLVEKSFGGKWLNETLHCRRLALFILTHQGSRKLHFERVGITNTFMRKKLFLGSIALTTFALSIILFQVSCQKDVVAQNTTNYTLPPATTTTLGGVIVGNGLSVTSNGTLSVNASGGTTQQNKLLFVKSFVVGTTETSEIWTVNYDGTNAQ